MNAAKAHYDNAAVQLSYAQIRSPISGVVADRPVYPGEMPASGTPLVSIVDISQVVARANVPVKEAASIKVGRPARITGPDGDLAGQGDGGQSGGGSQHDHRRGLGAGRRIRARS